MEKSLQILQGKMKWAQKTPKKQKKQNKNTKKSCVF
jgi:hypothetical protein